MFWFATWSCKTKWSKGWVVSWVGASHCSSSIVPSQRYIFSQSVQSFKKDYISWLPSTIVFLKLVGLQGWFSPSHKLEMSSICMHTILLLTLSAYLDTQKLLIFELQLCLINHGNWTGSWNLVIMTLYDTSTHATHMFWETLFQAPWNNIDHSCSIKVFILTYFVFLSASCRLNHAD